MLSLPYGRTSTRSHHKRLPFPIKEWSRNCRASLRLSHIILRLHRRPHPSFPHAELLYHRARFLQNYPRPIVLHLAPPPPLSLTPSSRLTSYVPSSLPSSISAFPRPPTDLPFPVNPREQSPHHSPRPCSTLTDGCAGKVAGRERRGQKRGQKRG